MHIDQQQTQQLLHGELTAASAAEWRAHLTTCQQCQTEVTRAEHEEAELLALLARLDHAPPALDAHALAAALRSEAIGQRGEGNAARKPTRLLRWAAGLALTFGVAGAVYAAPGSPLPRMLRDLFAGDAVAPAGVPVDTVPLVPVADAAGLSVAPGERLSVTFRSYQSAGSVTVLFSARADVVVRALSGTAGYSADDERITIDNGGSAVRFEIEIPHSAPWLEIRVADRRLLLKQGTRIRADVQPQDGGQYTLTLARPPR